MERLREAALSYYGDEKFSDFVIVCGKKEYKVHRCFISTHSKYFERACSSAFSEASERKIVLKEDLPEAVDCMIQYFYKFDYESDLKDVPPEPTPSNDGRTPARYLVRSRQPQFSMQLDAWVYAVAEKYEVPGLKTLALDRIKQEATSQNHILIRMICMAYTIYELLPLPPNDRALHQFLVDAWVFHSGSTGMPADTSHMIGLIRLVPVFLSEVTLKYMSGFQDRMWIYCARCNKRREVPRAAQTPTVECNSCRTGFVPKEGEVTLLNNMTIQKFW